MKNKNGITLVALVVTIIILLILAGISISTLTGSGLFENAREAEAKSKNAQNEENSILYEYANLINQYASGAGGDEVSTPNNPNEPIEITWGGKTLNVGDYVNYQAKVTNATDEQLTALNTQLNTYASTGHSLKNEALKWRVLDVVNGQLRLISETPTAQTVSANKISLYQPNGYNNAVYLIDAACKSLYNSSYASEVQNLKIEDIEEHLTYEYANSYVNSMKYGETKEMTSVFTRYYPNIFAKEKTGWVDGTQGTKLDLSQQIEADLVTGLTQASSKIKTTQTYWTKLMTNIDFENSIYYTLFINNGSNYATYWMSSRCVNASASYPGFYVRSVKSGEVTGQRMYDYQSGSGGVYAFRPVITLKSNVTIGEGDGKTIAYELNM